MKISITVLRRSAHNYFVFFVTCLLHCTICTGQDDLAATEIYTDGILLPRLQTDAVDNPVEGYLIYDINAGGIMYYDGSEWQQIGQAFIKDGDVVRQASGFDQDFIFGREQLPLPTEMVTDTFFFFDRGLGAFRAGASRNSNWSTDNVGIYSMAWGNGAIASGLNSTAWGSSNTRSTGESSTAWGGATISSGGFATSWGVTTEATGFGGTAWGLNSKAMSSYATAWGNGNEATGTISTTWGSLNKGSGPTSTVWGLQCEAAGTQSTAWGSETKAMGLRSSVTGQGTIANADHSFVIGQYNDTIVTADQGSPGLADPLFIIGNGSGPSFESNAMVVRKNGTVGIGTNGGDAKLDVRGLGASNEPHLLLVDENPTASFPRVYARLSDTESLAASHYWEFNALAKPGNDHANAKWNFFYAGSGKNILQLVGNGNVFLDGNIAVTSDRRLKSNIRSVSDRASDLLQLGGYTYNRKSLEASEIGLIAQEVEEYFPELVIENDEGYKTVNYDGLIPVLIEIIKNQEERIKKLEK